MEIYIIVSLFVIVIGLIIFSFYNRKNNKKEKEIKNEVSLSLENNTNNFPDIQIIENELLNSYYINHDESQIKIDGDGHNVLCACNKEYVRLWPSKHKSQEAIDEIGFLPKFKGVIVKDGTELYNKYGIILGGC